MFRIHIIMIEKSIGICYNQMFISERDS